MKKILLILIILIFASANVSWADWLVTATWTDSVDATNGHKVFVDGTEQVCDVALGTQTCQFTRTDAQIQGQEVSVVAYNTDGTPSLPLVLGNLNATRPATPTNPTLIIQWQ